MTDRIRAALGAETAFFARVAIRRAAFAVGLMLALSPVPARCESIDGAATSSAARGASVIVSTSGAPSGPAAPAAPTAPSAATPPEATPDAPSLGILRVIAATLATLACVLLVAALLRRTPLGGRAGCLRLESRLALARGGALAVVRIEGRRLVLGVTPGQINLLAELEGGERSTPSEPTRFDRLLSGVLSRERVSR